MMGSTERKALPGKLIAVEGIDGSGKSTQIHKELKSKVEKVLLRLPQMESPHDQGPVANN
jgi:thymidylate kinase